MSSNPIFNNFTDTQERILEGQPCTVQGTINKTILLLCVAVAAFVMTFRMCLLNNYETASMFGIAGSIIGLILVFIIVFNRKLVPVLSPVYAFCEGAFLGWISYMFEAKFPGIVIQATLYTFSTLFVMLFIYKAGLIKVTEQVRNTLFISTLGIAGIYFISFILSLFHIQVPAIYSPSPIGIAFSVIVCVIAAFNFLIDFQNIEIASVNFMPKYYEWFGAFGLLVTLVWVYIEILKLLAKLNSRR